jgi:RND family efflux transporter MFP subunit
VFCDVPENDVPHLHIGDPAIVKLYGLQGKPFVGTVTRFSFSLDPATRNMRTEIDLPNPEERLYPGMYAEVSLEMNQRPDALTVPAAAVGSDSVGNFVYTVTDNQIGRLAIKIGLTDNGRTEVSGGLSKDTPIVTTFRGAPSPGTAVRPAIVGQESR